MMALIQQDIKRLLGFHAVSQVGYMILGIGTALPIGVIGGVFHMVNHVCYKSCLFMGAGAVEYRTGTTDLKQMSGLIRFMPLTTIFFLLASLAITGFPFFNGFYSKEIVYQAAVQTHLAWYIAAVLGSFLTAASFLKVCHGCFFGPVKLPSDLNRDELSEAPGAMLLPMLVLSVACVGLGVLNGFAVDFLMSVLGFVPADVAHTANTSTLISVAIAVLLLAIGNHIIGYRATGEGRRALDHIHEAPVLRGVYQAAELHYLDPYQLLMSVLHGVSWLGYAIDRAINKIYDIIFVQGIRYAASSLHDFNSGSISRYFTWTMYGIIVLVILFIILL